MLTVDQIRPIRNQVLVRPDPVAVVTQGGIHIPEVVNANNPNYLTMTGTVLACGPGAHDGESFKATVVKAGDRVVFGRYTGKQIEALNKADDAKRIGLMGPTPIKRFLMMKDTEIIGLADDETIQPGYQAPKFGKVTDRKPVSDLPPVA